LSGDERCTEKKILLFHIKKKITPEIFHILEHLGQVGCGVSNPEGTKIA
jgi:hypothetical protein